MKKTIPAIFLFCSFCFTAHNITPAQTKKYPDHHRYEKMSSTKGNSSRQFESQANQEIETQYVQTPFKDFNADVPWRVEDINTEIPFIVSIKDASWDALNSLDDVRIYLIEPPNELMIYHHDFGGVTINDDWEHSVNSFENAWNPALDGLPITPVNLNYTTGANIIFRVEINGIDDLGWAVHYKKFLKIRVGVPLPKPNSDWYYGDTHYHSNYTDNPYEYGGFLSSTTDTLHALGLDWLTITDHASNFEIWDLSYDNWDDLRDEIAKLNNTSGLPLIQGEEITCQPVTGEQKDQIHLLVYNNFNFIPGNVDINVDAIYSLESRLNLMEQNAVAFAAHPLNHTPVDGIGDILPWSYTNYNTALLSQNFRGLELWNTRKTKRTEIIDPNFINPFTNNSDWETYDSNWSVELEDGVDKWDELLRNGLNQNRKIFIEGGSDAHGAFNYSTESSLIGTLNYCTDNALGKVRTLVYAYGGADQTGILEGLKNGNSVVTDGPVVIFGIDQNNDGELDIANDTIMGEQTSLGENQNLSFLIKWFSTSEFGYISEIDIKRGSISYTDPLETIPITSDQYEGSLTWSQNQNLSSGVYYYRIEARIKDGQGNTIYRAYTNPIWINSSDPTYNGYLDSNNPSDTHTITLPDDGELKLHAEFDSTLDIYYIRISDINNATLKTWYPTSGTDSPFYGLKAGNYIITINRYSGYGAYNLTTTFNAQVISNDTEPNDLPGDANPAPNNGSVTGHIGYVGGGDGSLDDKDYFKFTIPDDGEFKLHIVHDTTLDIYYISILDVNNATLKSWYPTSGTTSLPYGLKAGDYYILIDRYSGYGGYTLTTTYNAQTIPNDSEPNDLPGDANPAPNNGTVTGHLGYIGGGDGSLDDKDHFKFTIPDDGELKLHITNDSTLDIYFIRILDINNATLKTWYPTSGTDSPFYGLKAGDYYILIDRYSGYGGYTLNTTYNAQPAVNDAEPNDSPGDAILAPNNGSVIGHLGYLGGGDATRDEQDYYRVSFPESAQLYVNIAYDTTLDIYSIQIRDINGNLKATYYPTSGGTYGPCSLDEGDNYIRLYTSTGYGGYTLTTITPSIIPKTITVTSPNGGEIWMVGSSHNITWTSSVGVGDVKIEYSTNNGTSWSSTAASTPNSGSSPWVVPGTPSSSCLVRISEASDNNPSDVSDNVFTIQDVDHYTLTISANPGGTTDPAPGTYDHADGANVEVSAIPDPSWSFSHWSGAVPAGHEADNPIIITMDQNRSITANFEETSPFISLSTTYLNFGATSDINKTSDQKFLITNAGGGTLDWSISTNASWLTCTPMSGIGSATVIASVNPSGLPVGSFNTSIEVFSPGASNSPQSIDVSLNVISPVADKNPFGRFDTPREGVTVSANVPVTGWALDDIEVTRVQIKRSVHPDDPPAAIGPDGLIFVGNAVFVKGARPDVEAIYSTYPLADRAGWGYMMLTNMLPNGGNGTFTLYAFAYDSSGHRVQLGQKTIYCDNANRTKPFGTLDTPKQGGTASGSSYINFGWALTPQPKYIPFDGSTILVWVDGVPLGHPNYNNYREDIATKFPDYANSDGAVGYFFLDTTKYANGVHKISWNVRDNEDEADGIGARRFEINNAGGTIAGLDAIRFIEESGERLAIDVKGYERGLRSCLLSGNKEFKLQNPERKGDVVEVELEEVERLELHLSSQGGNRFIGWGKNPNEPLPECSTFDKEKGIFYWMPDPGYLGEHTLHFAVTDGEFRSRPITVIVNIVPKKFKIN